MGKSREPDVAERSSEMGPFGQLEWAASGGTEQPTDLTTQDKKECEYLERERTLKGGGGGGVGGGRAQAAQAAGAVAKVTKEQKVREEQAKRGWQEASRRMESRALLRRPSSQDPGWPEGKHSLGWEEQQRSKQRGAKERERERREGEREETGDFG
ncbi:hypothetical protein D8B26_002522 [Coccidioides posadasii str. Silveira]|uniref:Predicted protein n=2 Tax=Coccidioides posadasii TaxID=199306 RepID=E9DH72_COCPS|nr:predicted protein [Coccidioides posadasii str. Silveira]KMM72283.1 hypothetical protein CPAG_08579 [Coccidioides posadasii RMSCC 3488]QVM07831.1 hypothetical protein D8B26_002522 [Coccidioides posadasii str. Silveira]